MNARLTTILLRSPVLVTMVLFMLAPMALAVVYSFMTNGAYGGVRMPFTALAYRQLLFQEDFDGNLVFSTGYLAILWRSVLLAALTVVASLAIGLPLAWYMACSSPAKRARLLLLITLPFWINTLIRTYCWVLILRDEGLLNGGLRYFGLAGGHFLYNDFAILLGMIYTYLPFMVLPIYAVLERVDGDVIEASHDLYADRWSTFRRIVWPLAMPGAIAGSLLVFAPALGSFLAPDLLGGGRRLMIGSLIQLQFTSSRNWPFGAALASVVSVAILAVLFVVVRRSFNKVPAR
ncbi:ABC-type spermidine/putrescine transport system permease subunit I [Mesorhizobium loti]|uniref:ABC-type spermidine/putrescine transport system permease subunit I n=1 Tax=Rhizobium loti TaxID=381 RepID=A0A8E2WAT4_RHILI|nr:ABC transporter permease [Mesorhizobium loti]PWJ88547.1 ABC-type spermidine/putrescine transport system permease subunit I [Mesorhizobium loti]